LCSGLSLEAGSIVLTAVHRSVSRAQVTRISFKVCEDYDVIVAVDVPDHWGDRLLDWLNRGNRKLLVFGNLPTALIGHFGWRMTDWPENMSELVDCDATSPHQMRQSAAEVCYSNRANDLVASGWRRPFKRFDFADEWNNLGFGAIGFDETHWSVTKGVIAEDLELAAVNLSGEYHSSYAGLKDTDDASMPWFNRAVGPCDSFEWSVVEKFLSGYRHRQLPCHPVMREIPAGYDAAVTSRLDCDEDIESARTLWQMYCDLEVPFSLAVHTLVLSERKHHLLLREVLESGGAVLSHTANHAPNWGGSYDAAFWQGSESARALYEVTGQWVKYAVSPFHQSPGYALQGLNDAGYYGCIGGIIRNDPEFLLARGGNVSGLPDDFIGHSQQCMLHGDCLLDEGDPIRIYRQAFDQAYSSGSLFGYLDHPFSARYAYGWPGEELRADAHRQLIEHIRKTAKKPLFINEQDAMDFLLYRANCRVYLDDGIVFQPPAMPGRFQVAVEYQGQQVVLTENLVAV
jgi:hypothetical protein